MEPPETTRNHSKPLKTTQNHSKPLETTHPKPPKNVQKYPKPQMMKNIYIYTYEISYPSNFTPRFFSRENASDNFHAFLLESTQNVDWQLLGSVFWNSNMFNLEFLIIVL